MTSLVGGRYQVTSWRTLPRSAVGTALDTRAGNEPVFVKQLSTDARFQAERDELLRAATATQAVAGIRVPALRDDDTGERVLVMEHVDRPASLLNCAWEAGRSNGVPGACPPPGEVGRRLGAWLAAYAAAPPSLAHPDAGTLAAKLAQAARSRLGHIRKRRPSWLDPATAARIEDAIARFASSIPEDSRSRPAIVHGDFNLSNVLVAADGTLYVIDFADARAALAVEDLTNIWHTVEGVGRLSRRHEIFAKAWLDGLAEGAGIDPREFLSRPDVGLLRINQALVQILAVIGTTWLDRHVRRRTHWRLARLNRDWLRQNL